MSSISVQCQAEFDLQEVNRTELIAWLKEVPKGATFSAIVNAFWTEEREISVKDSSTTEATVPVSTFVKAKRQRNRDGVSRRKNIGWEMALKIDCDVCDAKVDQKCYNLFIFKKNGTREELKYPHQSRFDAGLRAQAGPGGYIIATAKE